MMLSVLPNVVPDRCPQCGANLPPDGGERIACAYCGSSLIRLRPVGRQEAPGGGPRGGWGVRLRTVTC